MRFNKGITIQRFERRIEAERYIEWSRAANEMLSNARKMISNGHVSDPIDLYCMAKRLVKFGICSSIVRGTFNIQEFYYK